jgi:hypothetical protein
LTNTHIENRSIKQSASQKSRDHVPVNWCAGQPLVSSEDDLAPSGGKGGCGRAAAKKIE